MNGWINNGLMYGFIDECMNRKHVGARKKWQDRPVDTMG